MAVDLAIGSVGILLNPPTWISPEATAVAFSNRGRSFVTERLRKMFMDEVQPMKNAGEIDEEVLGSERGVHSIIELANFLGRENPDSTTWDAAKKNIYSYVAKRNDGTRARVTVWLLGYLS